MFIASAASGSAVAGTSQDTSSSTIDTRNANYILLAVELAAANTPTVSDSLSNTWVQIGSDAVTNTAYSRYIFRALNPIVGSAHWFSATFASTAGIVIHAVALGGRILERSVTFGIDGANHTSHALSTVTAEANDDLVVFCAGLLAGTASTFTAGSGWTAHPGTIQRYNGQTQDAAAAGSIQDKFTTGTSQTWADSVIVVPPYVPWNTYLFN